MHLSGLAKNVMNSLEKKRNIQNDYTSLKSANVQLKEWPTFWFVKDKVILNCEV